MLLVTNVLHVLSVGHRQRAALGSSGTAELPGGALHSTCSSERICEHSISDPACLGGQKQHLKEQPPTVTADCNFIIRRTGMTRICTLKIPFPRLPRAEPCLGPGWHLVVAVRSALRFFRGQKSRTDTHRWATTAAAAAPLQDGGSTGAHTAPHVLLRINKSIFKPAVVLWRAKNQILSLLCLLKQKKNLNEKTFQCCHKLRYKVITLI